MVKKRVIVLSLGGSLIILDEVNLEYLKKFRKIILKNSKKYKFIIVCGGGSIARKYISALKDKSYVIQSTAGIASTRMNAKFMACFFDQNPLQEIPQSLKPIKKLIKKQDIVFSGALEFKPKQTSDSNAAEIAAHFKAPFINLTNVLGLYDKNPKKYKDAQFISEISWKEFDKMSNKSAFKPGQHFVLDQTASKIILKNKVITYILGKNIRELDKLLKGGKFKGTIISR